MFIHRYFLTALRRLAPVLLFLGLVIAAPALAEGRKLALVIGNQAYEHAPGLQTPVEDAQSMSTALRGLGFEVTVLTDAGTAVFDAVLTTFADQAKEAETVLFYYSGHAFQMDGVNHLIPVSAKLADAASIAKETWTLDDISQRLKTDTGQLLIFLDACRDNPLPAGNVGSTTVGLAQFDGGAGTFVSFATAPGQLAWDKEEGKENSPYTSALLAHIATPAQSLSDLMIAVRNDVEKATDAKQTPWEQSSLRSQFFFVPAPVIAAEAEADLPDFDVVEAESTVLPDETQLALAEVPALRLQPLNSETRSLSVLNGVPVLDPSVITGKGAEAVVMPPAADLPRAVQSELARINCYAMRVDGQWGNGSRNAMRTYYKAKNVAEGEVEPTEAVFVALKAEPEKTCAEPAAVVVKKEAPKATAKKSTTTKQATTTKKSTTKQATTTEKKAAPTQQKSGGMNCKFVLVAIICGP
jgi:Caspase domain